MNFKKMVGDYFVWRVPNGFLLDLGSTPSREVEENFYGIAEVSLLPFFDNREVDLQILPSIYFAYHGDNINCINLGVPKPFRGEKLARILVEGMESIADELCCERITVVPSEDGHSFWPYMGYEPSGQKLVKVLR